MAKPDKEALERLRTWIKPGDTVYTILRHVSASGMSRSIGVIGINKDGSTVTSYTYNVAKVLGYPFDERREGVKIGGCGMDMGFAVVYELSSALFSDGFPCLGEKCQSNDHFNGDRDYTPHMNEAPNTFTLGYVGHWHRDGGYALRQRWL